MSSIPGVTIVGFAGAGAAGFGAGAAGRRRSNGCRGGCGSSCRSCGLRIFDRSGPFRSRSSGSRRNSCRSGRLRSFNRRLYRRGLYRGGCSGRCGSRSGGLCSRRSGSGFRRFLTLDKLDLQLAFASRSRLFLLIRSIGSFGGRRLLQVLVAGFGFLAFAFGGNFDFLVVRGIHLGHVSTDSHARIAKQLHHDIDLDAVGFSPIYWFNLIFISHE